MSEAKAASGPDFSRGIELAAIPEEGTLAGRVGDEPVLLSRLDGELYAVGGTCTHYGGHLADGHIGRTDVRCPLHHACFDLKTGSVLRAPALDPLDRWQVEVEGDRAFVRRKLEPAERMKSHAGDTSRIVIIGGGAAGLACAVELRRLGFAGELTILSADKDAPYDRPNLSKDYLAGTAPEEWLPLRSDDWYSDNRIDLRLSTEVSRIDADERTVHCSSGDRLPFDRLLIATGSEPNRLSSSGFDAPNVFTLRTIADARAITEHAKPGSRAVLIGASFIAMEAAAALRHREVEVDIVAPEQVPFEQVLGTELGKRLQSIHEQNGVCFHLGTGASAFDGRTVSVSSGETLKADFVLVGIGVRPRVNLARSAGMEVDHGILVDEYLQTNVPGIYAAGDIAQYPDPLSRRERVRIEHWVVAERQGEVAAANMLGEKKRFRSAPFFWTDQAGTMVRYVGHAKRWDSSKVDGEVTSDSFSVRYFTDGEHRATATVGRDRENLHDELELENCAEAR
jgi:NADPH-dependent 2,4-dienoyl-CoA reductase/sulfur reductase-like enzyme/nitrite reductase/ring-hydroxylating ferredoxin subunit